MPAANWKARRRVAAADAQRPLPVIPQPAADDDDDPWDRFMLAFVAVMLVALAVALGSS
jgi:hypothetical protein